MIKKLICYRCNSENKNSKVDHAVKLVYFTRYYDEDGDYHGSHSRAEEFYYCSNGHNHEEVIGDQKTNL